MSEQIEVKTEEVIETVLVLGERVELIRRELKRIIANCNACLECLDEILGGGE